MTEPLEAPAALPSKADPETLVLRGAPSRVVRFRRSAVVAAALVGSITVAAVAWMGLSPPTFRGVATAEERLDTPAPPDELKNAPSNYGEVPKLGPPLPGDLGRPILAHQHAVMAAEGDAASADQARMAELQRQADELKTARESEVLLQLSGQAARTPGATVQSAATAAAEPRAEGANEQIPDAMRYPNAQQRKSGFLTQASAAEDVSPHRLKEAPSPYTLAAGSIISASLITGLNSDLPGLVTAQVTENTYDSATGSILLIPQGARLIGRYDSVVAFGQSRALVVWDRLLLLDGSSVRIDNAPATDASGYAGLADQIDRHSWQLLKGVALATLLGVGTELGVGGERGDIVTALRQSAQQNGARAGDQLVGRSLDVAPTIRVRPGWPLRVIVNKDMVLRPWRRGGA